MININLVSFKRFQLSNVFGSKFWNHKFWAQNLKRAEKTCYFIEKICSCVLVTSSQAALDNDTHVAGKREINRDKVHSEPKII